MNECVIVLATFGSADEAREIAKTLVQEKLIACANIVPEVRSIYEWDGRLEDDAEAFAILKTTLEKVEVLTARLTELHSYKVPEILALPIKDGNSAYLEWVRQTVN